MAAPKNSRYNYAELVVTRDANGNLLEPLHYGIRPGLVRINYPDSTAFSPPLGTNWCRIAWSTLGDSFAWWAIADYSMVVDPFTELEPRVTYTYVAQLEAGLPAGVVSTAKMDRVRGLKQGDNLRIENLDPSSPVRVDVRVQAVNQLTRIVTFTPVTVPAPGIPQDTSRVAKRVAKDVTLTIPSAHRYQFEVTDFANPMNVLEG